MSTYHSRRPPELVRSSPSPSREVRVQIAPADRRALQRAWWEGHRAGIRQAAPAPASFLLLGLVVGFLSGVGLAWVLLSG